MTGSCKVCIRAQISRTKFRQILKLFQIAVLTNLNRNTVKRYLKLTRFLIAEFCEQESPFASIIRRSFFAFAFAGGYLIRLEINIFDAQVQSLRLSSAPESRLATIKGIPVGRPRIWRTSSCVNTTGKCLGFQRGRHRYFAIQSQAHCGIKIKSPLAPDFELSRRPFSQRQDASENAALPFRSFPHDLVVVKIDILFNPRNVCFFCPQAIMIRTSCVPQPVEQFWAQCGKL